MSADTIEAKAGWSAYEGWVFTGRFTTTVKGGRVVWSAEQGFIGEPDGRWLPAAPSAVPAAGSAGAESSAGLAEVVALAQPAGARVEASGRSAGSARSVEVVR